MRNEEVMKCTLSFQFEHIIRQCVSILHNVFLHICMNCLHHFIECRSLTSNLHPWSPLPSNTATLSCNASMLARRDSMVAPIERSTYLASTSTSRLTLFACT